MRSFSLAVLLTAMCGSAAHAQQGFAVERLYQSAPGAGWIVMDDLDLHGGLGGAIAVTLGYAGNPLRVTDGTNRLAIVSDQAFADVGAAITYDRWRFYANFDVPIVTSGDSGTVGSYMFTGPSVNLGSVPDTISDTRVGADVRIFGAPQSSFRFGLGAQLYIPFGHRVDYDTDDTFRGMVRALVAGNAHYFTYAAQLGAHIRPLDDPAPGSPKGSELLFGAAVGARLPFAHTWAVIVGPELFGATAFRSFLQSNGTAFEGLLSGRVESTRVGQAQVRVKLGVGAGLNPHFGAAEWRIVAGVELFGRTQ